MSKEMIIASLRRKREAAEKAGEADRVERIDARIAFLERPLPDGMASVEASPAAKAGGSTRRRRPPTGKKASTVVVDTEETSE